MQNALSRMHTTLRDTPALTKTALGRMAVGDGNLYGDLVQGRRLTSRVEGVLLAWLDRFDALSPEQRAAEIADHVREQARRQAERGVQPPLDPSIRALQRAASRIKRLRVALAEAESDLEWQRIVVKSRGLDVTV